MSELLKKHFLVLIFVLYLCHQGFDSDVILLFLRKPAF
uniref:Uncharacterized protein n=1 Tax=Anguilla anguilla TaxID=7936 RepID=A0A0E9P8C2_ANGAN